MNGDDAGEEERDTSSLETGRFSLPINSKHKVRESHLEFRRLLGERTNVSLSDFHLINGSVRVFIDHARRIQMGKRNRAGINCDVQIMLRRDVPLVFDQELDGFKARI